MKQLFWIIFLFLCAIGLAILAQHYSGNVFMVINGYMIRVNLRAFVAGLGLAVIVLYVLIGMTGQIFGISDKLGRFGQARRSRKATQELGAAGLFYFEGKYQEVQQHVQKILRNKNAGENRILALMLGAHAAENSQNYAERDGYLNQIAKLPKKYQLPRYLLLAESALNQRDLEKAAHYLTAAAQINPRLTRLVQLQLRLALVKNDAITVLDKTEKLHRAGAISDDEASRNIEVAYYDLLSRVDNHAGMKACVRRIPENLKNGAMDTAIAQKYVDLGLYHDAIEWISKHYPLTHDASLLNPFVMAVRHSDERTQQKAIDIADAWLRENPQDARLLRCLGELTSYRQLWGKAQGYLEASLALEATIPTRLALAYVLDNADHHDTAENQRQLALIEMSKE